MEEVEQLRAELADLRIVVTKLLPVAIIAAATSPTSAQATRELLSALQQLKAAQKSDLFGDTAAVLLLGIASRAAGQFPGDAELQRLLASLQQRH
jgi:hypothetical protein